MNNAPGSRPLVVFGAGKLGELLGACLEEEGGRFVAAFAVDREFKTGDTFCGRPLLALDELPGRCPPADHDLLVAVGYAGVNQVRAEKIRQAKALGYRLASYVSARALTPQHFVPAPNVIIFEGATVQRFADIGAGTIIWPNACVCHHTSVGENVFIGPGAVICGGGRVGPRALIGAGAVIRDFLTVGEGAIVGAGSTLLRDLPDFALCNGGESQVIPDKARNRSLWPPKTHRG